jgi:enoyl-CoA hydratase/carnithine racemase
MTLFWQQLITLLRTIARSPRPVLAAMTGHSPAGGTVLCLYADYRVMAQGDYRVGLNEVQVGLPVPHLIQRALVRLVGTRRAGSLVMDGQLIGSDQAYAIGLVDEIAAPDRVLECTLEKARQWLALPQVAFQATREISRRDLAFMDQDPGEVETLVTFWFRPETQEALHHYVDSFRKRRDPGLDRPRRSNT